MKTLESHSRRTYLTGAGAAVITALAGCSGGGSDSGSTPTQENSGNQGTTSGSTEAQQTYQLGVSLLGLQDIWLQSFAQAASWYAEDRDDIEVITANAELDASKQISDMKTFINSGVDGIISNPVDSSATVSPTEQAFNEDIPVMLAGTVTYSNMIPLFVGSPFLRQGRLCGESMIDALERKNGSPTGTVAIVNTPLSMNSSVQRRDGFKNAISNTDITVAQEIVTDATTSDAATKVTDYLRTNPDIDGIYATQLTTGAGVQTGLERADKRFPIGNENHIAHVMIDMNAPIKEAIANEYTDFAVLDTPLFYNPMAMNYMVEYLKAGKDESVLPNVGNEVTSDQLTIPAAQHSGQEIWGEPVWAPARVREFNHEGSTLYPHMFDSGTVVDQSNYDKDFLWPNIAANF